MNQWKDPECEFPEMRRRGSLVYYGHMDMNLQRVVVIFIEVIEKCCKINMVALVSLITQTFV